MTMSQTGLFANFNLELSHVPRERGNVVIINSQWSLLFYVWFGGTLKQAERAVLWQEPALYFPETEVSAKGALGNL